jgi:hypothetical protein
MGCQKGERENKKAAKSTSPAAHFYLQPEDE